EFAELPFFMALPFAAPPDVPPDRAQALRTAFMAMCRDKAFVEEAEKLGIDMSPIDGAAILTFLARTAATPSAVVARYNAIGGEKKQRKTKLAFTPRRSSTAQSRIHRLHAIKAASNPSARTRLDRAACRD